jgi:hypothetical protein
MHCDDSNGNNNNDRWEVFYLRWILEEFGIIMDKPTPILADNQGAVRLANAHQQTRRTRQAGMRHFIILQWADDKFINFVDTCR